MLEHNKIKREHNIIVFVSNLSCDRSMYVNFMIEASAYVK